MEHKIIITSDGITTVAKYLAGKKVLAKGVAKCKITDTFDFATGARLAFDRLITSKYCIGDKVKVRNDLQNEVYYSSHGNLCGSVEDMCKLRGKTVTISQVCGNGLYEIEEDDFIWADTMFEGYAYRPKFEVGDKVIGNNLANKFYGITTKGWIGTVTHVFEDGTFHADGFPLAENCFDKYCGELYNGKVVCIDNSGNKQMFTVGKIYNFEDGIVVVDNGISNDNHGKRFKNFKELLQYTCSKFIEIKEDN